MASRQAREITVDSAEAVKVVLYARHSSDKQWRSTGDQVRRCEAHCERSGYRVARVFRDEDLSGEAIITRPGIRALIEAAFNGEFERVVTEDLSRISRDLGDVAHLYKRLRFLDIELESVTEGVINELHIGLKGTMNALFLKDLADKTHRGNIAAVLSGGVPGGEIYGYEVARRMDGRGNPIRGLRKVNEDQAAVAREIFAQYKKGWSLRRICEGLNARQIPSPKGKRWRMTALLGAVASEAGLLRQTLYKGVVTFNKKQFRKHPETGKRVAVVRPESEWLRVPAPELAIMDEVFFDAVQAEIAKRSTRRKDSNRLKQVLTPEEIAERKNAYDRAWRAREAAAARRRWPVVSGRLVCAVHGEHMQAIHTQVYNCRVKGCPNRNLQLERDLMPLVWPALYGFDAQTALGDLGAFEAERQAHQVRMEALNGEMAAEREEIARVLDALGKKERWESIEPWLAGREKRTRRIAHEIAEAEEALWLTSALTPTECAEMTKALRAALARVVTRDERGKLVMTDPRVVRPWIADIRLSAVWDDKALPGPDGSRWWRTAVIAYNAQALLKSLRPRRRRRRGRAR